MHCRSFVFVRFRSLYFCCQVVSSSSWLFSLIVVHTLWLKFVLSSSHRHRHVSCARWLLHLLHFFSLHLLVSACIYCCFSLSISLMSWITITRTSGEELGLPVKQTPPQVFCAQRPFHHGGLCRSHPGVFDRSMVPWRLRLRWHHHRSDVLQCVPKTNRSLSRRRLVVLSVVVNESWKNGGHTLFAVTQVTRKVTNFSDKNSESEQIRTLLDRHRGQIFADCQAEISKTRIPGWLWPKRYTKLERNERVAEITS